MPTPCKIFRFHLGQKDRPSSGKKSCCIKKPSYYKGFVTDKHLIQRLTPPYIACFIARNNFKLPPFEKCSRNFGQVGKLNTCTVKASPCNSFACIYISNIFMQYIRAKVVKSLMNNYIPTYIMEGGSITSLFLYSFACIYLTYLCSTLGQKWENR